MKALDWRARAISWLLHRRVFKEGSEPVHKSGSSHCVGLYYVVVLVSDHCPQKCSLTNLPHCPNSSTVRENCDYLNLNMKLWLKKVKTLRSSKAKKAELAEASVDAPQPARECEGAHWRKGIPRGTLVPLVKRHTSCVSSLRTEAGIPPTLPLLEPVRCIWVLTVRFNIHLFPLGVPGGGTGS